MKQNAKSDKPFTLNTHVLERVNKWGSVGFKSKVKMCMFFTVKCKNVNFTGKNRKQLRERHHTS